MCVFKGDTDNLILGAVLSTLFLRYELSCGTHADQVLLSQRTICLYPNLPQTFISCNKNWNDLKLPTLGPSSGYHNTPGWKPRPSYCAPSYYLVQRMILWTAGIEYRESQRKGTYKSQNWELGNHFSQRDWLLARKKSTKRKDPFLISVMAAFWKVYLQQIKFMIQMSASYLNH